MQILLSELISNEGKEIRIEVPYERERFQLEGGNYRILEKRSVCFFLRNIGENKIRMEAVIDLTLEMRCDRCLEPVKKKFYLEDSREFEIHNTGDERIEAMDEMSFINGNSLDVEAYVQSEMLMNWPMKVLCKEDCKGICYRCGMNLNHGTCDCDTAELDPRMAKIRDIFKNL